MRKKKKHSNRQGSGGFDQLPTDTDFYTGAPAEQPLYQDRPEANINRVRKTARHQAVTGRRKETVDPREKMALVAILRAAIILILIVIAFFLLWKGVTIYEESVWMQNQNPPELAPVMRDVPLAGSGIGDHGADESFETRVQVWKDTERLVRSVGDLLLRDNIGQAIDRCNQALELNPYHIGALEHLSYLYLEQGRNLEAVNACIRLVNVDPSNDDFQLGLLKSLDAYGDADAIIQVALMYQEQHVYNEHVQRYMAHAYFLRENYADAAVAYERALKDAPQDVFILEQLAVSYMRQEAYGKALPVLEKQAGISYRDQMCYKRMTICNAQLGNGEQTVQLFAKSAHLFGADTVGMWIQDPLMDPVRLDRSFKMFADSVMTEEYRKYLEQMAQAMEKKGDESIAPLLEQPDTEVIDAGLLRRRASPGQ